ncbi:hypothetical protein MTO96_031144, partial [Rhipicephalus appendiculatus]
VRQYLASVNMNALAGVNALVWVAIAIAVLINEAAALEGGLDLGGSIGRRKNVRQYLASVNMNALAGVNALVWVAIAIALLINEAAALEGGLDLGGSIGRRKK